MLPGFLVLLLSVPYLFLCLPVFQMAFYATFSVPLSACSFHKPIISRPSCRQFLRPHLLPRLPADSFHNFTFSSAFCGQLSRLQLLTGFPQTAYHELSEKSTVFGQCRHFVCILPFQRKFHPPSDPAGFATQKKAAEAVSRFIRP